MIEGRKPSVSMCAHIRGPVVSYTDLGVSPVSDGRAALTGSAVATTALSSPGEYISPESREDRQPEAALAACKAAIPDCVNDTEDKNLFAKDYFCFRSCRYLYP